MNKAPVKLKELAFGGVGEGETYNKQTRKVYTEKVRQRWEIENTRARVLNFK